MNLINLEYLYSFVGYFVIERFYKGDDILNIKYILSFFIIAIILSLVGYFSRDNVEIAPLDKDLTPTKVYWTYEGKNGPNEWMNINGEYEACGKGVLQSPININTKSTNPNEELEKVKIDYQETIFNITNNGYTIEAKAIKDSNSLYINNNSYELIKMHFHTPSEHELNGNSYSMEGHLVHENSEEDIAVIGFFVKEGKENNALENLWTKLPKKSSNQNTLLKATINLEQLLPDEIKVYQYVGSLTTPPCTEGVQWFVLEKPIEMSKEQIQKFKNIFPQNNRPVQPLNNRDIFKIELK